MARITRRDFAKTAGVATATRWRDANRVMGANDRVRIGFIGLGNRGDQVLSAFLEHKDCEIAAVCDIYQPYVDFAAKKIGGNPKQYKDYRELLANKDLDAVAIATPDHWHALMCVAACAAGKDVYVEKPLSLCVAEGRAMVKAARTHKRIVQCGIQRMSSTYCQEAAELIRSGAIGKVTVVRAFHVQNEWPKGIGNPPDSNPPEGFDWDAWVGPAPLKEYNKNRGFYRFRWFYDFSGGQVTNFGVHYLAQIHSSLGVDAPTVGGRGAGRQVRQLRQPRSPRYDGGTLALPQRHAGDVFAVQRDRHASAGKPCEIEFRGTKGTMYFRTNGYEIVPEIVTPNEFLARTPLDRNIEKGWRVGAKAQIEAKVVNSTIRDADHARNFLDCVKSRKAPTCDVEYGHHCTTAALIGNIAHRAKAYLEWDTKTERFTNNEGANKRLSVEYRKPYKMPT